MSLTHTVGVIYRTGVGTITNTTDTYTGDGEVNIDDTVAGPSTNKQYAVTFLTADIASLCIYSDVALTLKTNTTTGVDVITLLAGKQVVWNTDHDEACPIASNVTALYVTNAGATVANLKIRVLLNSEV